MAGITVRHVLDALMLIALIVIIIEIIVIGYAADVLRMRGEQS